MKKGRNQEEVLSFSALKRSFWVFGSAKPLKRSTENALRKYARKEDHTYEELKNGIDEYILFYNQIRPHKKLKYVSPCEFEEAYYNNLQS